MRPLALALLLSACTGASTPPGSAAPKVEEKEPEWPRDLAGKPARGFRVPTTSGGFVAVPTKRVTMLVFVGGWSMGSSQALSHMQALHADLAARGLDVIAVAMDEELAHAAELAQARGATFTIGWDPWGKEVAHRWAQNPYYENSVFLIDRRGIVRHVGRGGKDGTSAGDPEIRAAIEALLAEP